MRICGRMEQEEGPYAPTIVWEPSVEVFLGNLIQEQEFDSDIFEEIERALSDKVYRRVECQRTVVFSEDSEFPDLAVHLVHDTESTSVHIVGIGLYIYF